MAARNEAKNALPTSHFFITVARGRGARTMVARPATVFASAAVIPLLLLWFCGSTFFLVFHDNLVASLLLRQRDMQYGYEDRIAALRSQLDRETSQQLVSRRSVEMRVDELAARESDLQSRSGVLAQLQQRAGKMVGLADLTRTTAANVAVQGTAGSTAVPMAQEGGPPHKPQPDAAVLPAASEAASSPPHAATLPERLSLLSTGLDLVDDAQQSQVSTLDSRVRATVGRYHAALSTAGLSETRLAGAGHGGSGGPFIPLTSLDDGSPFARAVTGLQLNLGQAEELSRAVARVPFNKPLAGDPEITSPFGPRIDPFLGRAALHAGVDLSEDTGTEVLATAPGRITAAGTASGYGTMVEIDHGAGLTTRYAHLSETAVTPGQTVKTGDLVGRVGATGRATGPHLHYETRIDGEPVDPLRFMAAGQRLQAINSTAY